MASVARLRDLTHRIQTGQPLTEVEAHEILYFSPAEYTPTDAGPEILRVVELMQRMQNGPPLTEAEISEVLRLRKQRFVKQLGIKASNIVRDLGALRAQRSRAMAAAQEVAMAASNDDDPAQVEIAALQAGIAIMGPMTPEQQQNARETMARRRAEIAEERAARLGQQGERVDCMEVHRVSATFKDKLPLVAVAIREDLGAGPQHPSFIEHLDATIGKCVRESPLFESKKKPNSSEVRSRDSWLSDYDRVKARLTSALVSMPPDLVQLLGDILDFVFKHGLEECYVSNFLYDTAHAYEGERRENESSCPAGAAERVYTTLFNCIKGMNRGVFGELNRILGGEQPTSWEELDKASQTEYQRGFDRFVMKWAKDNLENGEVKAMTPVQRNEAVLAAFKAISVEPPLPPFVEDHIRRELFGGLTMLWPDFGYNSENAANAGGGVGGSSSQGGRRTRHKKRRNRKTHRKNKKSLRRR